MTVIGEDKDMNASVTSSYSFYASHADFLPLPKKQETVSQRVTA